MGITLNLLLALAISSELAISSLAWPLLVRRHGQDEGTISKFHERSENTCADSSLARTIFEGFAGPEAVHTLNFHYVFVHVDTLVAAATPVWTVQGPVFRAWHAQQPFTVPLFGMQNSDGTDGIYMIGADVNTPPIVTGFTTSAADIVAYVYDTQVCGSVPLMSAVFVQKTDHYYTTDPDEHAGLLESGWEDSGVVAFVLPLTSS